MCTLLLANQVLGPGTLLIAANRDEDPARPSAPPTVLREHPRLVGGRDLRAGGTWLSVRAGERPAVAALLNRRPRPGAQVARRSRGELPLLVACADDPRAAALAAAASGDYAPCTLLWAEPHGCWRLALREDGRFALDAIAPGWHAFTHAEMDDPLEPRAHALHAALRDWHPPSRYEAVARASALLASHGEHGQPAVCLHDGPVRTVSAARIWFGPGERRYEHAEGRPCTHPFSDQGALLEGAPVTEDA